MVNYETTIEEKRLESAIKAIKAGDHVNARSLLDRAIADDPEDDRAWQWLAVVANTPEEQQRCLYRALSINPNNMTVREALGQLSTPAQSIVPTQALATVPVPTVFQPIVYYDRPPTHRLSSYIVATFLFCISGLGFTMIIAGSFLPWVTVAGVEMAALEREGFMTLVTGVVGILVSALGIWRSGCLSLLASVASISFALIAIIVSAYNVFGIAEPEISPGLGFILVLFGGIIAILSGVVNSFSGLTMLSFAMKD